MGADHARIVAEDLPGATLQVVCDKDLERARRVADTFGAGDAADDPDSVFVRGDVDAVIVASPDITHASLSLAGINARRPVLCEKPLSQSSAECLSVIDAEMQTGRRWIQLGFMRRYDQSYEEVKAALTGGLLGRALVMHNVHRNVSTPAADFTGSMAISNSAPHEFDIARYILETEFLTVAAFQPRRSDDLVAPVVLVLETVDGQLVNIEINNNAAYGYDVRGELVGERASIELATPIFSSFASNQLHSTSYSGDWRPRYRDAYRRQNKDFVRFVETGLFPERASDCWDGYAAAAIAEAGVDALRGGRKVPVEMIERPTFYSCREDSTR